MHEAADDGIAVVIAKRVCITDRRGLLPDVGDEVAVLYRPPRGAGSPCWATAKVTEKYRGGAEPYMVVFDMDSTWSTCSLKPGKYMEEWVFLVPLQLAEDGGELREYAEDSSRLK